MRDHQVPVWCVHMGRPGGRVRGDSLARAERLAEEGYIALGWPKLGDLGELAPSREAFRARVRESYGADAKNQSVGPAAGMNYRFVHEMGVGDIVVSPSPMGKAIRVGRVAGGYRYEADKDPEYKSLRRVEWLPAFPRDAFTAEARRSLMARLSLFRVGVGANEFRRVALRESA